jgi:hypothetical protein
MTNTTANKLPLAPPPSPVVELVPVAPSLEDRAAAIRKCYDDVSSGILTAVERALDGGLHLLAAKADPRTGKHGRWAAFVARSGLQMRTAQNWMRLAKQEDQIRQLLAEKTTGLSYLTMDEALREVTKLETRKKPKRRKKREPGRMLAIFGRR